MTRPEIILMLGNNLKTLKELRKLAVATNNHANVSSLDTKIAQTEETIIKLTATITS